MAEKEALPPGPRRYPVVGNLPHLKGDGMLYEKLDRLRPDYGDVMYLSLGSMKMVVIFGHDKVKAALTDDSDKFKYRPDWLQEIQSLQLFHGLVWSNSLSNERLREFVKPVFHGAVGSQPLTERVKVEAETTAKRLTSCNGHSSDLKQLFYLAICNINCGIIFGKRYDYTDETFLELTGIMDKLLQKHGVSNFKNFFPLLQKFPDSKKDKHLRGVLEKLKDFTEKRVDEARPTFDGDNKRSLVDLFIEQEKITPATDDDVITAENLSHIIRDLFVAGSENVACGLLWFIAYMVRYPDIQDKCRQAVLESAADSQPSTEGTRPVYIQATVKEILRLANVAPLSVPHATKAEVTFGGFTIPEDCMVLTHLVSVHMDPKYWEHPTDFRPDRFIGEQGDLLKKEAYYPFSIGPRYCVADKLAVLEIVEFASELVKHFKFESDGDPPSLKPTQPGAFVEPEQFKVKWTTV